uniref:Uncharacterized protein n=1 Tax=Romanomermis culicivorax TaxID=13658 RepID=A0A915IM43_ROMCU
MDNSSLKQQNDRVEDEMIKTITVSIASVFSAVWAIAKKISTNQAVVLCTTLPVLANIAYYSPLLLVDAFGWDAIGTCSMKAFSAPKNMWIMLSGVVNYPSKYIVLFLPHQGIF